MLRINSSVSSGLRTGPSTRWRMPCTRMTGGVATRTCRSEAPSDTTNCNKSDIEYAMLTPVQITHVLLSLGKTSLQLIRHGYKAQPQPTKPKIPKETKFKYAVPGTTDAHVF